MNQKEIQKELAYYARMARGHIMSHDKLSEDCEHHYGGPGDHRCRENLGECDVRTCPLNQY